MTREEQAAIDYMADVLSGASALQIAKSLETAEFCFGDVPEDGRLQAIFEAAVQAVATHPTPSASVAGVFATTITSESKIMPSYAINTSRTDYTTKNAASAARVYVAQRRNGLDPSAYAIVDVDGRVSVRRVDAASKAGSIKRLAKLLTASAK